MELTLDTLMITTLDRFVRGTPGGGGTFISTCPAFSITTTVGSIIRTVNNTVESSITL